MVATLAREDTDAAIAAPADPVTRTEVDAGLFAGRTLGNYALSVKLGSGAMGTVYLAHHTLIKREVAVKILHTHIQDQSSMAARFMREARAISSVQSPHIVELIDFGKTDEGYLYLVMERLDGETLADHLKRTGALGLAELCRIGIEIARGLEVAHAAGIIHRDLKPANIFLTREADGRAGPVKLLDFGLAKLGTSGEESGVQTHSDAVVGSPVYMSPEQCRGDNTEVTTQSDLYSLGVILYEMAVGAPPFPSGSIVELLRAHAERQPPRASRLRPELPDVLDRLIAHALEKDPRKRVANATFIATALEQAKTAPAGGRFAALTKGLIALAIVLAVVLGGLAISRLLSSPSPPIQPRVEPIEPSPSASPSPSPSPSPVPDMAAPKRHRKHSSPLASPPPIIIQYPERTR